jgi:AcrR family transcriptional regulator
VSPARKAPDKAQRRARGSLSEEEILQAAAAIIERDGVDALSMPNLAKDLKAGVMSIYWYFHSKDELLGALADRALKDVYSRLPAAGDGPWDDEMISRATSFHRELRKATLYLQVSRSRPSFLALRPDVIPVLAPHLDAELQLLRQTSIDISEATRFLTILSAYTRGFALMQIAAEEEGTGQSLEQAFETLVRQLNPTKYPTLRAASDPGGVVSARDDSFDTCLRLLVAGLKAGGKQPSVP